MNEFYYFLADILEMNFLHLSEEFEFLTLQHCFELLALSVDLQA